MSKTPTSTPRLSELERKITRMFSGRAASTEEEYLALGINRVIEYSDGCLEVPALPTESHQDILIFLFEALRAFVQAGRLGKVLLAARPVRLWSRKYREPDILFMKVENAHRRHEKYWDGADLVMEVVSADPKDRERDLVTKRHEYTRAGIPEYWIVDPLEQRILVLTLGGDVYDVYGEFGPGEEASSLLLPGFRVAVDDVFAAASA